jgi:hypothetical protein
MENVLVKGAPGYRDFIGTAVPGLGKVPVDDDRQFLAVVLIRTPEWPSGEPVVVPMRFVTPLSADEQARIRNARLYREEWAVKTGRPASRVYIPDAIRPRTVEEY